MADGATPEVMKEFTELKTVVKSYHSKVEELEKQSKRRGEDAVTKAEAKALNDGIDRLKDKINAEINALHRKANRPAVAQLDAKSQEFETKANLQIAAWHGKEGDAAFGAAFRPQYKAAFDKMVRRGEKSLTPDESKTLAVGSAPDGGYYIEPARSDMIVQRLRETSPMRDIATAVTITSSSIKMPVDRDDVTFEWVGEQSTRNTTTTPQVGELEIPVHELSAMPKATQNLLDDIGFDVEGWLNDKIADRFARGENTAFITGNGTSRPAGLLSQVQGAFVTTADPTRAFGALQYIFTGSSGAFKTASATVNPADDLLALIHKFNAGYRKTLRWAMNRTTLGAVRSFKDQQGNYNIYNPIMSPVGVIDTLYGYPVSEFADIADYTTANAFAIALGDFRRGYLIVDRQGVRQLRDVYTDKPRVLFYTTKRVGGAIVDSDAIKVLKFGTS